MQVATSSHEDRPVSAAAAAAAAAAAEEKELTDAPPDVRLLVKRRQMFEIQEALEAQKQQYAVQVAVRCALIAVPMCLSHCALLHVL